MIKTNRKRWLTGSSCVQFHLISLHFSSAVPCRHAHTLKLCQSHYRPFQWPDCSCREPWKTNCSGVQLKCAGHFSALHFISLYCSDLPNSHSQDFNPFSRLPHLDQGIHPPLFSSTGWPLLSLSKAHSD